MKISLQRRHALKVEDGALSQSVGQSASQFFFKEILYLEGHPNHITGSRVTANLQNGWILPISGASPVEGLGSTRPPHLVLLY